MSQTNNISKYGLRSRQYRVKNPNYDKEWRLKHQDHERKRAAIKQAEFRANHPEKAKAQLKAWRARNKSKIRQYMQKWRETHRVELALHQGARNARTKNKVDKTQITNWQSRICGICKKPIEGRFHIDHKIPLVKGGLHVVQNLQLAHPTCNLQKKDKLTI